MIMFDNEVCDIQLLHIKRDNYIRNTIVEKVLGGDAVKYISFIESKPEQLVVLETVFTHPSCYPSFEVIIKYKGKLVGSTTFTFTG